MPVRDFEKLKALIAQWCVRRFWQFLESFAEVVIVVFFGIVPFLLAVIRHNALKDGAASPGIDISTVFAESFSGGQLYLYAFSLLGTLFWLGFFNWTIPYRAYRLILAFVVVIIALALVALGGVDPTFSTIKNPAVVDLSIYFYAANILIYFLLLMMAKSTPPSVKDTLRGETSALIGKLHGLEGQKP